MPARLIYDTTSSRTFYALLDLRSADPPALLQLNTPVGVGVEDGKERIILRKCAEQSAS